MSQGGDRAFILATAAPLIGLFGAGAGGFFYGATSATAAGSGPLMALGAAIAGAFGGVCMLAIGVLVAGGICMEAASICRGIASIGRGLARIGRTRQPDGAPAAPGTVPVPAVRQEASSAFTKSLRESFQPEQTHQVGGPPDTPRTVSVPKPNSLK